MLSRLSHLVLARQRLASRYSPVAPLGSAAVQCTDDALATVCVLKHLGDRPLDEAPRLVDEYRFLRAVDHPALPRALDLGSIETSRGREPFFTHTFTEGRSLVEVAPGRDAAWASRVLASVVDALVALHEAGVRHGDVKPENIIVTPSGDAVLIDLSCAAALSEVRPASLSGTREYFAPEQLRGDDVDHRADYFALGRTIQWLRAHAGIELPAALAGIERSLCAESPSERPSTLAAVRDALPYGGVVPPITTRLVGRIGELARVAEWVAKPAGAPDARALLIVGEPGAGRTRLLEESRGMVAIGHDVLDAVGPVGAQRVAMMIERVLDRPVISPVLAAMAFRDALVARGRPVFVTIDDIDDLAPSDADLLAHIERALEADDPLRFIITARTAERRPDSDVVSLGALSDPELDTWIGAGVAKEARRGVVRRTGRLPGRVARFLRALRDHGAAIEAPSTWPATEVEPSATRNAHELWLRHLDEQLANPSITLEQRAATSARRAQHLLALGSVREAERALAAGVSLAPSAPTAWLEVASAFVTSTETATLLLVARVFETVGDPVRALGVLRGLGKQTFESRLLTARCALKSGDAEEARALADELMRGSDGTVRASAAEIVGRASIRLGRYQDAIDVARAALPGSKEREERGPLLEVIGVAASYLGDDRGSVTALEEALSLGDAVDARGMIRVLSYLAIASTRRGDAERADTLYADALAIAEKRGVADQLSAVALNLASGRHRLARYAEALEGYVRARRIASALGQRDVLLSAEFNLARLMVDIGVVETAQSHVARAGELASATGNAFMLAALDGLRAELAVLEDRPEEAHALFLRAEEQLGKLAAHRERAEVRLARARAALALRADDAAAVVRFALDDDSVRSNPELASDARLVEARGALAEGDAKRARELAQVIVDDARALPTLRAEAIAVAAEAWRASGAEAVAAEHAVRARSAWERIAADLPSRYRDRFWAHPLRRALVAIEPPLPTAERRGSRGARLERLIEVYRALASTNDASDVLRRSLDAAIDLTGAERGFIVLRDERDRLRVAVARNVDQERLEKSHAKFSRGIAERVIATGAPVLSVDAEEDDRLRMHASVHSMKLRSVLAVPIVAVDEMLGAIYLDNRFQRGRFSEDDLSTMCEFADQVALTIRNARLVDALRTKTAELEAERARIQALADGQQIEIERLRDEVAEQSGRQRSATPRYPELVGRSEAMERVFELLDRLVDNPLNVLVVGESGTGKELVARALHRHGPRKDRALVSVNCAAIPANLLESELFGHVRGAFTGADSARVGLIVGASGGTLFLDELGELSLDLQAKLLRVIQEREVRPLGGSVATAVDFRLVCATNRDLRREVDAGRFREDLYYRVAGVEVRLPPLRDRMEDVPAIVERIRSTLEARTGRSLPALSRPAVARLLRHTWPGNVRELENVVSRALLLATKSTVAPDDIVLADAHAPRRARKRRLDPEAARRVLAKATTGADAARSLGVSRATLYRWMKSR